jgi:hypothetical protein
MSTSQDRVSSLQSQYDRRLQEPGGFARLGDIAHKFFSKGGRFYNDVVQFGNSGVMSKDLACCGCISFQGVVVINVCLLLQLWHLLLRLVVVIIVVIGVVVVWSLLLLRSCVVVGCCLVVSLLLLLCCSVRHC